MSEDIFHHSTDSQKVTPVSKKVRPKALPTKVHCYGCSAPLENEEAVWQQMSLANRYRNQLVEIERRRRADHAAILENQDAALTRLDTRIGALQRRIEVRVAEKKTRNSAARKRCRHPELDKSIKTLKAKRKLLYAERKAAKTAAYQDPANKEALKAADEAAYAAVRAARKIASKQWGLAWGTYLTVEDAAQTMRKGTPPDYRQFNRRNGGTVAVQIQSNAKVPRLTVERLFDGASQYVKVIPEETLPETVKGEETPRISRRRQQRPQVLVRLCLGGQDPAKKLSRNNPPVYTTVRATLHRPLPAGCHVTWVKLIAKSVGPKFQWEVHFTVAKADGFPVATGNKVVGIDIGYRSFEDGSLRVAYWSGNDGRHGELRLPAKLVKALAHKDELQSLRDQKFDIMRATLVAWKKCYAGPEWFQEATSFLPQWRSANRLKDLAAKWKAARFPGDAGMYDQLDAWCKEDKHHLEWLASESQRARNRRDDLYRKFAASLRACYGVCGLEDLDLREHAEADHLSKTVQKQRARAAISRLRLFLASGLEIVKVPAPNTTARCHRCLHLNHVGKDITYHCVACEWSGDRDYNASQNILREVLWVLNARTRSHKAA
jgi:hypothetical protein